MTLKTYHNAPNRPENWPKALLITFAVLVVLISGYFLIKTFGKTESNNQEIAVGEPNPNSYDCTADVYNCDNFTTQSEAQVAFDSCFKQYGDVWGLDNDNDGVVCESLSQ